jgi:hypothetical protein
VTSADRCFAEVLKGLRPLLAQNGFSKSSQNFVLESPECWAVINLQKSRWSQPDETTFYVNVGVTAKRLLLFQHERVDKAPAHFKCAWNVRAEQCAPEPMVQEWTVRDERSVHETVEYLQAFIGQFVIPRVKGMLSENGLLKMWADDGRLGYPLLKAKSIILAGRGDAQDLARTLRRLQEVFGSGIVAEGVDRHIAALQREFPDTMRRAAY